MFFNDVEQKGADMFGGPHYEFKYDYREIRVRRILRELYSSAVGSDKWKQLKEELELLEKSIEQNPVIHELQLVEGKSYL